jgi:transglutaminase-like putative cysteine protease
MRRTLATWPIFALVALAVAPNGCGDAGDGADAGADGGDSGADSDADVDSDADADTDTDTGGVAVGALLRGIHHSLLDYAAGTEAGVLWIPLPLDHATQTPLYVELAVDPPALLDGIAYSVDDVGNFGASVTLTAAGAASDVAVHWDGVVLTRDVDDAERPVFYAAATDPDEWTVATPVADAAYPGIADTAAALAEGAPTALDKMIAVIGWTSTNIGYDIDWSTFTGFDATSTYESGQSSCTGFANLATALGRAAGVPTRTLANYYVGLSQQTHYINEFYLGDELGWRRVEPQASWPVLAEEYALAVRLVRTADEDEGAMSPTEPTDAPGIPTYSLVEELAGGERMALDYATIDYFADCAACDNRAELQAELVGQPEAMADLFDRARSAWLRDRAAYVDGTLSPSIMTARRAALDAASMDDVDAILAAIE